MSRYVVTRQHLEVCTHERVRHFIQTDNMRSVYMKTEETKAEKQTTLGIIQQLWF